MESKHSSIVTKHPPVIFVKIFQKLFLLTLFCDTLPPYKHRLFPVLKIAETLRRQGIQILRYRFILTQQNRPRQAEAFTHVKAKLYMR